MSLDHCQKDDIITKNIYISVVYLRLFLHAINYCKALLLIRLILMNTLVHQYYWGHWLISALVIVSALILIRELISIDALM